MIKGTGLRWRGTGRTHNQQRDNKNQKPLSIQLYLLYVVAFLYFLSNPISAASCRKDHRDSLLSLTINISSLSSPLNWSSATNCCVWEGIACDASGQVTRLWLPRRDLYGTIKSSIRITTITHMNLSQNLLYGHLPDGFFTSLNQLQVIDLSNNHLSGELPLSDGFASSFNRLARNLTAFILSNNSFTGRIPSSICLHSPSITLLDLSFNEFQGVIPQGFGACQKLKVLRLGFNFLSGWIPSDIYSIVTLTEISLPANKLIGSIRDGIGNLSNLRILELYENEISGLIPESMGKLLSLEILFLHVNNLSSTIPPSLMNCTKLKYLNLRINSLEGRLSSLDFSKMSQLSTVDLGNNNFIGSLPSSLFSCKSLMAIRLNSNQLEGKITPDIAELQSLSFLSVSRNRLTNFTGAIRSLKGCKKLSTLVMPLNFYKETMPSEADFVDLDGFRNLRAMGLGGCELNGQFPAWLANLKSLEVLDLSFNQITGSIPGWLGTLPKLFYLDLSSNYLLGNFPTDLTQILRLGREKDQNKVSQVYLEFPVTIERDTLSSLLYKRLTHLPPAIYLRNNSLSGKIPIEIGQMKLIHCLDLSMNNFSGQIPDQVSNLTNLELLNLSGNKLSGVIPASLRNLHFLTSFDVSNNNLQGPIPTGGQFDTFPLSSFLGNPGLCGLALRVSCGTPPESKRGSESTSEGLTESFGSKFIFGLVIGMGFSTGFTLSILTLWLSSRWRLLPKCLSSLSPF